MHIFSMRKDSLSVGRGGSSAWVDVQVITASKVSREHFRLRRDASGRFFIQDVSLWGTTVNGEALPPPVKTVDGVAGPGPERELPGTARIGMADVLVVQFEAVPRQ
jgi:pSer/pThr/pTyr-binding forkhead associated (FHA) protein